MKFNNLLSSEELNKLIVNDMSKSLEQLIGSNTLLENNKRIVQEISKQLAGFNSYYETIMNNLKEIELKSVKIPYHLEADFVPSNEEHLAGVVIKRFETIKESTAKLRNFFGILKQVEPRNLAIFGGAVRDWWLVRQPKDIDIVIDCPKKIIKLLARNFDHQKSQFDGYHFTVDGIKLDVWRLQDSWAFRRKNADLPSWDGLLKNVPFNIDGVLVFEDGKVMDNGFFDGMNKREIELVNPINKNSVVNIVQRALKFKEKYGFSIGPKLQAEINKHNFIDLNKPYKVQVSRSSN